MSNTVLNFTENDVSLENLKKSIKNIAVGHSQEISKELKNLINKRKFDIVKMAESITSLEQFKVFEQTTLTEVIKTLGDSVRNIMDSSILVKDRDVEELVPLPYEVLTLIFTSTSEQCRQQCLQDLMKYYYNELNENIKKISTTIELEKEKFEQQVKVLLPIVKLETIKKLSQNNDLESQKLLDEIISNIILFFKYPRLNQEDIFATVNNKLGSNNYKLLSYKLIPLDERNGYLGDYFRLKVNVKFEGAEKTLNLFAKFLLSKPEAKEELENLSKKEKFFHLIYFPLLKEHGLQSLLDFTPKYYFYRLNDVIIMDDMTSLGFTTFSPHIKLEYDSLIPLIKQLAKMHACSMIIEEKLSKGAGKTITLHDLYEDYVFEIVLTRTNKLNKSGFGPFPGNILHLVKQFPEFTKNIATDEFEKAVTRSWEMVLERIKKSDKFKNTICHGDMHCGNMLFKYGADGRCQDASLIDWQTYRYCPPVHDLLFAIHQNLLKDVRDKHSRELIDLYYTELSTHFKNFNIDIDTVYPKTEFEESLIYMRPHAVFHAILYSFFTALDPRVREKLYQGEEAQERLRTDSKSFIDIGMEDDGYKLTLSGLAKDLVELYESGYL